ncbi:odorant receptor 23a isoform X2 [Drosophila hydei]|uniref:Odorant receptor n=1 Tax=Drosophila hydei TaxID=7224 RepID=A0A6J1LJE9_DROHY|nr:odorant receptor 23a isoform X2 [Drosophila hydei]
MSIIAQITLKCCPRPCRGIKATSFVLIGLAIVRHTKAFIALGGVDLYDRNYGAIRYWGAVLLNILVTLGFPVMLFMTMFSFELPLDNLINFNISLTSAAASIKFVMYAIRLKKIAEIEQIVAELDRRVDTDEQRSYQAGMSRRLQIMSTVYKYIYGCVVVTSSVSFLFRAERSLPFPAWFPLDWTTSLTAYMFAVLHQILAIVIQVLQNFVDDLFPPMIFLIIVGQCELLVQRLSLIGYDQCDQLANERKLIGCIRDHKKLFGLHQLTMDIISWPLLVQFVVISIDVGTALCALLFYAENMNDKVYFTTFIFAMSMQIFPICYYGTMVEYSFGYLHYAVYSSNWVDQSISYRKSVLIFAERTQRLPKQIAGNFIPIALTTFLANCKAAYSFCTLLADTGSQK